MSASEKDRVTQGLWRCTGCGAVGPTVGSEWRCTGSGWQHYDGYPVGHSHAEFVAFFGAPAIATARAEGETAGYARGRREAFSEAAEMAATFAPPGGYDTNTFGGVAAMKAGDDIAAVLRAKAGEGDPK